MNKGIKSHYLSLTLIIILIFTAGCYGTIIHDAPSPSGGISGDSIGPTAGIIIIAGGADITKDCTPLLNIFSEEATQMSFSGDGENWTEWIDYDTSKISPQKVSIPVGGSYLFTLHGYDLKSNEVPLDNSKVTWTKPCGVGNLSPITGLSTTYTAPSTAGERNIIAHYNNLQTGAVII